MQRSCDEQGFVQSQRHLPHWELEGAAYFLTWRCLPGVKLEPADRDIVARNLRHWDGRRYLLFGATVMPDHVHLCLKPFEEGGRAVSLARILHSAKSYTALAINRRRGRTGSIWQEERFDRILRSRAELRDALAYIHQNAVAEGLVSAPLEYQWLLCQEPERVPPH